LRRRVLLRAIGFGFAAASGLQPQLFGAQDLLEQPQSATAQELLGQQRDARPISQDNPRIWPAVSRDAPLPMGAVDAFRAPARAAEMGVQWQRILFDWSAIQRHGPNDWTFGWSDLDMARREREAGRPMIGQFMSTPSWASGTSDPKSPPLGLEHPADDPRNVWATWVGSVARRYAGVIDTWVMWNEPDVWSDENHARQWLGTVEQYYRLLKVGYQAAKHANPRANVLMAGMTYWWDAAYGREQYFERVLRLMTADPSAQANDWYFDGAVLQLYNDPRGLFDAPRIFREIMTKHGLQRPKPVWVNEFNAIPWDDPAAPLSRAHFRATQDEQASFMLQAIAYALAGGVERVAVFKMLDDSPIKKNVEQAFGLVRADETMSPRPAFRTFQLLRQQMAPTARAQCIDEGPINRVYLEQPALGRRMTAIWNTSAQEREALIPALGSSAEAMDKFGQIRPLSVAGDGHIHVTLPRATANTIPGFPDSFFIGGEPLLVLEPLVEGYEPFAPTLANLPPPGQR
jgi:hypothetical protein